MNKNRPLTLIKICKDIDSYFIENLEGGEYFACIYGSYATGKQDINSDIDIIFALPKINKKTYSHFENFIKDYHLKNNLKIDNEVPFSNKLMISYSDFKDAALLKGLVIKDRVVNVPRIVKSKKFLASKEVKLRLAYNSITSPHVLLGTDEATYQMIRQIAEQNLLVLAKALNVSKINTTNNLISVLLEDDNGVNGEMYLGYKPYEKVKKHLTQIINSQNKQLKVKDTNNKELFYE